MEQLADERREQLRRDSGTLAWSELAPHFARGVVITVTEGRDLLDVAEVLARDDTAQLQQWLDDKSVAQYDLIALETVEEGGIFSRIIDYIKLLFIGWFS